MATYHVTSPHLEMSDAPVTTRHRHVTIRLSEAEGSLKDLGVTLMTL